MSYFEIANNDVVAELLAIKKEIDDEKSKLDNLRKIIKTPLVTKKKPRRSLTKILLLSLWAVTKFSIVSSVKIVGGVLSLVLVIISSGK